jgi:hypothetical protein
MAEQPETPPLAVLHTVIIARWAAFALFMPRLAPPPFGGNAFGAFIGDDMMQVFAPTKLARRAIGDRGEASVACGQSFCGWPDCAAHSTTARSGIWLLRSSK